MQNQYIADLKLNDKNFSPGKPLLLGMVMALILLAALAGMAPLWGISPLIVAGFVLAVAIGFVYLQTPVLALYSTIFVNLLPQGLLPDTIQSVLSLLLLVISLVFWGVQSGFQRRKIVWTAPLLCMLAFFLWAFITVLWADDLTVSRQTLVQYTIVITVMFLLINQVNSPRTLDGLMNTLAAIGWILIVMGLWTVLFGGYELGARLQIFDMNENLLGMLLMVTTPGVIWQAMRASRRNKTISLLLSLLYIGLSLILIAFSGSRGSFIGYILILVIFGTFKATRPWALWGAALCLVGLISAPVVFTTVLDRFTSATEELLGERDLLWQAGLLLIVDHLWSGVGIGNGPYAMLDYVNAVSSTDLVGEYTTRPAHNPILEVGDDTGIVGIVLYSGALLSAMGLLLWQFFVARHPRLVIKPGADKVSLNKEQLAAYCSLVFGTSVGFLAAWLKSGGLANHLALFILFALWMIPGCIRENAFRQMIAHES